MTVSVFSIMALATNALGSKSTSLLILWCAILVACVVSLLVVRRGASVFVRNGLAIFLVLCSLAGTAFSGTTTGPAFTFLLLSVAMASIVASPVCGVLSSLLSALGLYAYFLFFSTSQIATINYYYLLLLPFFAVTGFLIGTPNAYSEEDRKNEAEKLETAYAITRREVKERELRERELYDKQRKLYSLMKFFQELSSARDQTVVKNNVIHCAKDETNSRIVLLLSIDGNSLKIECSTGIGTLEKEGFSETVGQGLIGKVASDGKTLKIGASDLALQQQLGVFKHMIKTLLAVPIEDTITKNTSGVLVIANKLVGDSYLEDDEDFLCLLASEASITISNIRLYAELDRSYHEIIQVLAQAIEAKDPYTHGHVARVERYARHLAYTLGFTSEQIELIAKAAVLHDIGKISVPDRILMKPGALTKEEFAIMQTHAINAKLILKDIHSLPQEVVDMIIHHHERFDGKGYPDGLAGSDIPLGAQIIALADTFDAMTSDRPYRKGFSVEEALTRMKAASGDQFNPDVLEKFLTTFKERVLVSSLPIHSNK